MNQETDIADGQSRNVADLLVAEVALKLQINDLALILRQCFHHPKHLSYRFLVFEQAARSRAVAWMSRRIGFAQWRHAVLLLANVECEIATHGKQPLRKMVAEPVGFFLAQPEKGLLNDLTGSLDIAEDPRGIPHEVGLVLG